MTDSNSMPPPSEKAAVMAEVKKLRAMRPSAGQRSRPGGSRKLGSKAHAPCSASPSRSLDRARSSSSDSAVPGRLAGRLDARQMAMSADQEHRRRREPQDPGVPVEARQQQHEFAIAVDEVLPHLVVGVALRQPLAHQQPQIAGEIGIGIVDVLVLADKTPDALAKSRGPAPRAPDRQAPRPD